MGAIKIKPATIKALIFMLSDRRVSKPHTSIKPILEDRDPVKNMT